MASIPVWKMEGMPPVVRSARRGDALSARRGGADKTLLTVGRVQTPTLAMVVARDREIEAFVPVSYITISAQFKHENGEF